MLTSSSPSRDEDFFCKTAISRREDIVSCIDVTIMDRFAHSALPSPYSKIFPAFGAGAAVTPAAGLDGKGFIDFRKPHACVSALVQQHGSKCAPARIEDRLGKSSLGERRGIYVADEDSPVGLDQAGAELMQEIFSPIRDLGMNRSSAVSMAGTLRAREVRLQVAVKTLGLDRRQSLIAEGCKSAQPQIDSETRHRTIEDRADGRLVSRLPHALCAGHTNIQIPASAAVFAEITRPQFEAGETVAIPQRQPTSREVDLSPSIANRSDLKGDPAQGAACTATPAPGEPDFSMLSASPRVLFRDLLHRLDGKLQGTLPARDPFEKRPEIKPRQKPPLALEHFDGEFVVIIEYRVDLARQAAKPRSVLVLDPQAQDSNTVDRSKTVVAYSLLKITPIAPPQTSRNAGRGRHARLRVSLSLAGLKASVSRGEIR